MSSSESFVSSHMKKKDFDAKTGVLWYFNAPVYHKNTQCDGHLLQDEQPKCKVWERSSKENQLHLCWSPHCLTANAGISWCKECGNTEAADPDPQFSSWWVYQQGSQVRSCLLNLEFVFKILDLHLYQLHWTVTEQSWYFLLYRFGISCSVCLDAFKEPSILPCQHVFCLPCLKCYIQPDRRSCPKCRTELPPDFKPSVSHPIKWVQKTHSHSKTLSTNSFTMP